MRRKYSYKWASERVKNVLGLAFAIPKKDEDEDAPQESLMRGGQKVNPHLMKVWSKGRDDA